MENTVAHIGMNKLLLVVVLVLICFGAAEVYTSTAQATAAHDKVAEYYLMKHLSKVLAGFVLIFFFARVFDYGNWLWFGRVVFAVGVILTIAAILFGPKINGAHRWIWGIQPSEILKLGLFSCVCAKLSQAGDNIKSVACTIIQPGIFLGISAVLLALQPNFSMLAMFTCVVACVLLVAGANPKYLGMVAGAAMPVIATVLMVTEHSRARIMAFFAEDGGMKESNHQLEHSLLALGNGGFTGTGFGQGVQKLGYLPEAHKDVVYSVIGEEFGLVGTLFVLALFAVLFSQGLNIARNSSSRFGKYFAFALTLSLFFNFALHISVCVGLCPTTGQPLPFFSFGGTNLFYSCIVIGILLNISRPTTGKKIKEPYMSGASLESSAYRNYEFTRSGV